jgi:hypothetical protein
MRALPGTGQVCCPREGTPGDRQCVPGGPLGPGRALPRKLLRAGRRALWTSERLTGQDQRLLAKRRTDPPFGTSGSGGSPSGRRCSVRSYRSRLPPPQPKPHPERSTAHSGWGRSTAYSGWGRSTARVAVGTPKRLELWPFDASRPPPAPVKSSPRSRCRYPGAAVRAVRARRAPLPPSAQGEAVPALRANRPACGPPLISGPHLTSIAHV